MSALAVVGIGLVAGWTLSGCVMALALCRAAREGDRELEDWRREWPWNEAAEGGEAADELIRSAR